MARAVSASFFVAVVLALLSAAIERSGPEQVAYSNLCGPTTSDFCDEPALSGGFPLAYLVDAPGVSVERQLTFNEDNLKPWPFAFDVLFYAAAVGLATRRIRSMTRSWSRRAAPGAPPP